jgi:hypothetical protein
MKTSREPGRLDRREHELHLAFVGLQLTGFRDLVVALAKRYPRSGPPLTGVVGDALRNLRDGVWIIKRRRLGLRKRARRN